MHTAVSTRSGSPANGQPVQLHTVEWTPDTTPIADLLLLHGYAEHSGRYEPVAEFLCDRGFRVVSYDQRGHGRSTGVPRGTIDSFDKLVDDAATALADMRTDRPTFVWGHSMGGLLSVRLAERPGIHLNGLVVASASLVAAESIPKLLVKASAVIGKLAPKLGTVVLEGDAISRVQSVRDDYNADPLNYRGKVPAGTGRQLLLAMNAAIDQAGLIRCPVLVVHGEKDRLADPSGARLLMERLGSDDTTLRTWPEAFHELHHEPERDQVLGAIGDWLVAHTAE